jgi:hypothetical protein
LEYASALERLAMRRYAVRFLVAILTFALGVALSLALGLFKPREIKIADTWSRKPPCRKNFRVHRPDFVRVDTELADPLKLVYLGETTDGRMKFLVENRRDQTVTGLTITGNWIWGVNGTEGQQVFEWSAANFDSLRPGESRSITTFQRAHNGLLLRTAAVTFQSGFTWVNPRETTWTRF